MSVAGQPPPPPTGKPSSGVAPDTLSWSPAGSCQPRSENPHEFPRIKVQLCHVLPWSGPIILSKRFLSYVASPPARVPPIRALPCTASGLVPMLFPRPGMPSQSPPHHHPVPTQPSVPECLLHEALPDPSQQLNESPQPHPNPGAPYLSYLPGA